MASLISGAGTVSCRTTSTDASDRVRQQLTVGEEAQRRGVDDDVVIPLPGQGHHLGQLVRGQQLDDVGIGLGAQQGVQPRGGVRDGGGEDLLRGGGLCQQGAQLVFLLHGQAQHLALHRAAQVQVDEQHVHPPGGQGNGGVGGQGGLALRRGHAGKQEYPGGLACSCWNFSAMRWMDSVKAKLMAGEEMFRFRRRRLPPRRARRSRRRSSNQPRQLPGPGRPRGARWR